MKTISWQCAECEKPKLEKLLFCEKHLKEEYERYDREGFDMKTNKDIEARRLGNSAKGPEESHTPTPWIISEVFKDKAGTIEAYQIFRNGEFFCETESRSKAEITVRAVNSHDALLEAVKDLREAYYVVGTTKAVREAFAKHADILREAIKQAEDNV